MTLFGDLYTKAIDFFVPLRFTPSKEIVSRVITSLFPECKRTCVFKKHIEYACYSGLVERCKISTNDTPILIPNNCETCLDRLGHLTITCPTLHVVNGNIVTCTMTFGKTMCLMVKGASLHIQQQIDLTQSNVDGLVYLCEKLKFCKGMRYDENFVTSTNYVKEDWSRFCNETQIDQRVRSPSCKVIVSFLSKVELCLLCRKRFFYLKKRKAEVVDDACIVSDMETSKDNVTTLVETPSVKLEPNVMVAAPPDQMTIANVVTEPDELHNIITLNDIPERFNSLLESQLRNNKKGKDARYRRWNPDIISLSLGLYCRSPSTYHYLKSSGFLTLPSKRLLQYYKNSMKQQPGYVDESLTPMVRKADRQKISEFGKHGGILIDEMTMQDD
ncbi:hypothetical protein ACJMK2_010091 [Sinanodonta woodiana]|uniref:Uncharacterized protein n=1 Tax=Sinanodonta woodiana TaxID=1069815 RepID=A0ABD3VE91_SINWO